MIVLNAGVPRSGTVLVNAILRRLFESNGVRTAQANPHGEALPRLIEQVQQSGQDRHKTVLVHTHSWDARTAGMLSQNPYVTGFVNYRDPRDVCVSLMRLHDHDFRTAAQMVLASFRLFEATVRQTDAMVIPYELLVADKPAHIFQIARRLGFWPGLDLVDRIDAETSVKAHRDVMEQVVAGTLETLAHRQNSKRVLVEDTATLINDRHIQSGAAGRWRQELSTAERQEANAVFAVLLKTYGYAD